MLASSSSGLYDGLVAIHVVCAVVGFGSVVLSGIYGGLARNPDNVEEARRYFGKRGIAEWMILPVPFVGAVAQAIRPHRGGFGDVWVIGGVVIWVLASALVFGVVRPAEARIRRGEGGRSLMWAGVAGGVLFVVALALMVTQPG